MYHSVLVKKFKKLNNINLNIKNDYYKKIIRINKQYLFIYIPQHNAWYLYLYNTRKLIRFELNYLVNYVNYQKADSFMIRPFLYFSGVDQHENSILAHKAHKSQFNNSYNQFTNMEKQFKNYSSTLFFI
jgi:hypothetical protein